MSLTKDEKIRRRFLIERLYNQSHAQAGPHDCVLVLDHLKPDYNIGKAIRSADVLGARRVDLVGVPFFDPGPSVGSFKHVPASFSDKFEDSYQRLVAEGYTLFALDPAATESLLVAELPRKSAFIIGNEGVGHSFTRQAYPGVRFVRIPQYGRAQSLNASIAATLALYEYVRRHGDPLAPVQERRDRTRDKYQARLVAEESIAPIKEDV